MSIATTLEGLRQRLAHVSDTPSLDAQVLLAHTLGVPRAWILAHPQEELAGAQEQALQQSLARLEAGEPLPYVLGHWEFYGLDFLLTPQVLIPRPETELLVEQALDWLGAHPGRRHAADVGTGSGCIGVSLAVGCPDLQVVACDLALPALHVARANASRHAVSRRMAFFQADLLPAGPGSFDLICANLPYIPTHTLQNLKVAQAEPRLALHGGAGGLDQINRLLGDLARLLRPGGLALLEIEASQGPEATALAQSHLPEAMVRILQDLAGHDRLLVVALP